MEDVRAVKYKASVNIDEVEELSQLFQGQGSMKAANHVNFGVYGANFT